MPGEIKYIDDMPMPPGTLYGVFLQSTHANAKIDSIDSSQIHVSRSCNSLITNDSRLHRW